MNSRWIPSWNVPFGEGAPSRRRFLRTAASAVGGGLGAGFLWPTKSHARDDDDDDRDDDDKTVPARPIPGGDPIFNPFTDELLHVYFPGPPDEGLDPSTITDFSGFIAAAVVDGMGTAVNTRTGETRRLLHEIDLRVMQGVYRGIDGSRHRATFALV